MRLKPADARAIWSTRQKLGLLSDPTQIPGGWIRSLGGIAPYVALWARSRATRGDIDSALADSEIWVVPGVRGCIWLVPRAEVPLALAVSEGQARKRLLRELSGFGVELDELTALGDQVVLTLEGGALSPAKLAKALPEGAARSLGPEGKKKGHNTTLPTALRLLEWAGRIRRHHGEGRLDTNRYRWGLPTENPLSVGPDPGDEHAQANALARHFLGAAGPATLSEFTSWSALTKTAARKALAAINAVELEVEGIAEACFDLPIEPAPWTDEVFLLPPTDNLVSLRARPGLIVDAAHHDIQVLGMGKKMQRLADCRWLLQRPVVHRGQIVGFWEWDPSASDVVVGTFAGVDSAITARATMAASELGTRVRDELDSNAKQNSIDGDKSMQERAALI